MLIPFSTISQNSFEFSRLSSSIRAEIFVVDDGTGEEQAASISDSGRSMKKRRENLYIKKIKIKGIKKRRGRRLTDGEGLIRRSVASCGVADPDREGAGKFRGLKKRGRVV